MRARDFDKDFLIKVGNNVAETRNAKYGYHLIDDFEEVVIFGCIAKGNVRFTVRVDFHKLSEFNY